MDLAQQLRVLVERAPQDGITPHIVALAVNPALEIFAKKLKHSQYYVMQSAQKQWVMTTISNRVNPTVEKKVIYAFTSVRDAMDFQHLGQKDLLPEKIPVAHILFQLFALKHLDSVIFLDTPQDSHGKEVRVKDFQEVFYQILGQVRSQLPTIPQDLA